MSVEAMTWAFAQEDPDLATGAKFLLVAIANRADKAGVAFAGNKTFASDCACRVETVTQNMKRLEGLGMVARFQRRRANGSRTTDWIVLAPSTPDRSPMVDASSDEVPDSVANSARDTSPEETSGEKSSSGVSSGEVQGGDHLRKTGGPPDPSGNRNASDPVANAPGSEARVGSSADASDRTTAGRKGEPSTAKDKPGEGSGKSEKQIVRELFEFWQRECDKPGHQLTDKRRAKIRDRLRGKGGDRPFTPREIAEAIRGAARAAYVDPSSGKRFDDLELICRSVEKVEDFRERYQLSERGGADDARRRASVLSDDARRRLEEAMK